MTESINKNKGGRPKRVLTEQEIEQVSELAGRHTIVQIANYLGIGETSFHEIKKRQPEVLEAYKKGRQKAIDEVASLLIQKARDGDVTSMIFYLKTQAGWSEKQHLDITSNTDAILPSINVIVNKANSEN